MKSLKFCLALLLLCGCSEKKESTDNFDELMGKKTKHWSYVRDKVDVAFLSTCQALFEKNRSYLHKAQSSSKIPKTVHFIWLGPKPFPPESVENIRTWIAKNPGWTVKFWTDRDRPLPCKGMQKVRTQDFSFSRLEKSYHQSQNWGEKSDILRYEILFQEGGVYADHDANCLQPFETLHSGYDFYCGMETPHEAFVGRNVTCGNGVIGSRPRHPTIKKVIDLIGERWDGLGRKYQGKDVYSRTEVVMQRTYIALTDALKGTIDQESNVDIVLPAAYFFAKSGLPSLYSKHFYATAWSDQKVNNSPWEKEAQKKLSKIKQKSKNLYLLLLLMFAVNILIITRVLIEKKPWLNKKLS